MDQRAVFAKSPFAAKLHCALAEKEGPCPPLVHASEAKKTSSAWIQLWRIQANLARKDANVESERFGRVSHTELVESVADVACGSVQSMELLLHTILAAMQRHRNLGEASRLGGNLKLADGTRGAQERPWRAAMRCVGLTGIDD